MARYIVAVFLLSIFLFALTDARYVHRKSRVRGVKRLLKGFVRSNPVKDASGKDTDLRRIADIETELSSDVVIYDETEEDDFEIIECRFVKKGRKYIVDIKGKDADKADFDAGTTFIIGRSVWAEKCPGIPLRTNLVPSQEQTLFFKIKSCSGETGNQLELTMKETFRRTAIGRVRYSVHNSMVNKRFVKKRVNFERNEDDMLTSRVGLENRNLDFPTSTRASISYNKKYDLIVENGISASVSVSASAGVENFDGDFDLGWSGVSVKASFETFYKASASAVLEIEAKKSLNYKNELLRESVPSLSYDISIPFVGDLSAGAFVSVDFVASLEAQLLAEYTASVEFEKRVQVTLQLYPDTSVSTKVLSRTGTGNSAIDTTSEVDIGSSITGFAGIQPAVGVGISLGKVGSASAEVSISAGLEASIEASETPYSPISTGRTVGVCDKCHYVRGSLSAVGKDLKIMYDLFGNDGSKSLSSNAFEVSLGSICAISTPCNSDTCGGTCASSADCASGQVCQSYSGKMVCVDDIPNLGSCDPLPACSVCSGSCYGGTCFSSS